MRDVEDISLRRMYDVVDWSRGSERNHWEVGGVMMLGSRSLDHEGESARV
jgi:hypothetical protein